MLLELKDIKKYYPLKSGFLAKSRSYVRAVDGVDLTMTPGENLGLIGESGSGKTTLGRIILKLLPVDSGTIVFDGKDITRLSQRRVRPLRRDFQMIFQDPYGSLDPRFTVTDILKEGMLLDSQKSPSEKTERARELLSSVKLSADTLDRFPHEFSGGERQRIAIARALATNPKLLILDEAVSSLDVLIQEQIVDLLREIQKKFSVTYLFISHNLRVVKKLSARISVMYRGKIVESAPTPQLFSSPLHPYTQELLSAALEYKSRRNQDYSLNEDAALVDQGNGHWVRRPHVT